MQGEFAAKRRKAQDDVARDIWAAEVLVRGLLLAGGATPVGMEGVRNRLKIGGIARRRWANECVIV